MRKRNKKYKPYVQQRMSLVQIDMFLEPFVTFINQVENDNVWVDDRGVVLMDLLGEVTVEDAVRRGERPLEAIPNLSLILETYYQVCRLSHTAEFTQKVDEEIETFRAKILKPLDYGSPIQLSSVDYAKQFLVKMRSVFSSASVKVISQVYTLIDTGLAVAKAQNKPIDLRKWIEQQYA